MKELYVVFDTSALKTCCNKDPELEDERVQLKQLRTFLMNHNIKINWYYSTDIVGEYRQIPTLIKQCKCDQDTFGQAFLLALRRMAAIKNPFNFSQNIIMKFSPIRSPEKIQKCIDDNVKTDDRDDIKFIQLCASIALKGSRVWLVVMDRELKNKRQEILIELKRCGVKGEVNIMMPGEFLNELKTQF